jgi:hypothetical protein
VEKRGFETRTTVGPAERLAVEALDASGAVLGRSGVVAAVD